MIQTIAKIIDFIILLTLLIVLIHTFRYFKLAYQSQNLITLVLNHFLELEKARKIITGNLFYVN